MVEKRKPQDDAERPKAGARSFVCPTCCSTLTTEVPTVDLDTSSLHFGGTSFHLAPQEAEFMAVLVEVYALAWSARAR